jgi:hypothetical protein
MEFKATLMEGKRKACFRENKGHVARCNQMENLDLFLCSALWAHVDVKNLKEKR